jgi:Domain of unknown function (DUF4371)
VKYNSPLVKKKILHIFAQKVKTSIREEIIGETKFCLIVDEFQDETKKKQMTICFLFIDSEGLIKKVIS